MQRRPNRDRLSVGELEKMATLAEFIAEPVNKEQSPSDDRRQVRRLATMIARLARHLQNQE